jgi:trans-aconitate 2-methyltransferase
MRHHTLWGSTVLSAHGVLAHLRDRGSPVAKHAEDITEVELMTAAEPPHHVWDALHYDRLPLPHEQWGARLLSKVHLSGEEHVLDAGCGTGRDTIELLKRLPHGHVTAVDASAAMLRRLREKAAGAADRLTIIQGDLTAPLSLHRPADVVFSVATLHWIPDHDAVFPNFAHLMAPGARLAFECGGRGNITRVRDAVHRATGDDSEQVGWRFADPLETEKLLFNNGFVEIDARLRDDPAHLPSGELFSDYLATVVLGRHLARIPPEARSDLVHAVAAEMAEPVVDYVRLEVTAQRRG